VLQQETPPSPGVSPVAVLGYDTTGDGQLDAFDTNQVAHPLPAPTCVARVRT
jgi:hypothetical protein